MLFDFDRFKVIAKLAYRKTGRSPYSLEEVLQVFQYYFETYEMILDAAHPMISIDQVARIIEKMPFVFIGDDGDSEGMVDISADDYEAIIDRHFATKYKKCDYNINHFFSGKIRDMRFYEVMH